MQIWYGIHVSINLKNKANTDYFNKLYQFSVADKEVEADNIRKNTSEQVVMIQGKLEDEIRKRADVIKQKKKTESQIQDLESQIVGQNKYLADLNKELIL